MTKSLTKKIYYHDTDCGGVVYYANYLKHLEEGRTEYFSEAGISVKAVADEGTYLVVARVDIRYRSPARYQDTITVETEIADIRRASILFRQRIVREKTVLVEADTALVCVGRDFRPRPVPEDLMKRIRTGRS